MGIFYEVKSQMSLSGQWCLGSALIYAHYNYVRVDVMILGIGVKILEGFII